MMCMCRMSIVVVAVTAGLGCRTGLPECLRHGDEAMAEGRELLAVSWYHEAAQGGSEVGRVKEKVARRALEDACAEPSPAVIDHEICRAACLAGLTGEFAHVNARLLERYAGTPRFSIARSSELPSEERHRLACELASVGNMSGIAYLLARRLVDVNDVRQGGVLHYAALAGDMVTVKWLVGLCGANAASRDENGRTPDDWIVGELKMADRSRRERLESVRKYLSEVGGCHASATASDMFR